MRWHILLALVRKEIHRHLNNRGSAAMALLLLAAVALLTVLGRSGLSSGQLLTPLQLFVVQSDRPEAWLMHLRQNVPAELAEKVQFTLGADGPPEQLDPGVAVALVNRGEVAVYFLPENKEPVAPYLAWLRREAHRYTVRQAKELLAGHSASIPESLRDAEERDEAHWQRDQARRLLRAEVAAALRPFGTEGQLHLIDVEARPLDNGMEARPLIVSALVLFALFFTCVYLLPSMTCEERERGVLLAQALSPARPIEILAAKFFFYPVAGVALAVGIAAIYQPTVLAKLAFWLAVVLLAAGGMGVGLTLASLARTQRAASLGAMCYMLIVTVVMVGCQKAGITNVPNLFLEYHGPKMLHAVLTGGSYPAAGVGAVAVLAVGWLSAATIIFRRFGWQ